MVCINDSLPSDLLLMVLKFIDSKDMVKSRRCCRDWNQLLEEHRSFWKELNLPEQQTIDKTQAAITQFDLKSRSGLRTAYMNFIVPTDGSFKNRLLVDILQRSSSSLQIVCIQMETAIAGVLSGHLGGCSIEALPNLVVFRLEVAPPTIESCRLMLKMPVNNTVEPHQQRSNLKVLSIPSLAFFLSYCPSNRLKNLVSLTLSTGGSYKTKDFLTKVCTTLKHLQLPPLLVENSDSSSTKIHFPLLEVLELPGSVFPSWISAPSTLKVRADSVPDGLPNVSSLWITDLKNIMLLSISCPQLQTLRVQPGSWGGPYPKDMSDLLMTLHMRSQQALGGGRANGMKFKLLEKLIFPLKTMDHYSMSDFTENDYPIVDSEMEPNFWEVEI